MMSGCNNGVMFDIHVDLPILWNPRAADQLVDSELAKQSTQNGLTREVFGLFNTTGATVQIMVRTMACRIGI